MNPEMPASVAPPKSPNVGAYDSAVVIDVNPIEGWVATLTGVPELALLARILQKLNTPEMELLHVRYDAPHQSGPARIELQFKARPARAHSVVRQWGKIITVHEVTLQRLPLS